MPHTGGFDPADSRSRGVQPDQLSRYIRRNFRRTLRGYDPVDVDQHLEHVRGWFSAAGFDKLVADNRDELLGSAQREADAIVEDARQQAGSTIEAARSEARDIVEDATRRAAAIMASTEQRLASLRSLAETILEDTDTRSDGAPTINGTDGSITPPLVRPRAQP